MSSSLSSRLSKAVARILASSSGSSFIVSRRGLWVHPSFLTLASSLLESVSMSVEVLLTVVSVSREAAGCDSLEDSDWSINPGGGPDGKSP